MSDVKIQVKTNGPFLVTGKITLLDAEGKPFELGERETIALCRCGASGNSPLCDGAHKGCGFSSCCEAREL